MGCVAAKNQTLLDKVTVTSEEVRWSGRVAEATGHAVTYDWSGKAGLYNNTDLLSLSAGVRMLAKVTRTAKIAVLLNGGDSYFNVFLNHKLVMVLASTNTLQAASTQKHLTSETLCCCQEHTIATELNPTDHYIIEVEKRTKPVTP